MFELGPGAPAPGSYTICVACNEVLRFDDRLQLRTLSDADWRTLDQWPDTVRALDQLRVQIAVARKPAAAAKR